MKCSVESKATSTAILKSTRSPKASRLGPSVGLLAPGWSSQSDLADWLDLE